MADREIASGVDQDGLTLSKVEHTPHEPRGFDKPPTHVNLGVTALQELHAALLAALAEPTALSTRVQLGDAANGLEAQWSDLLPAHAIPAANASVALRNGYIITTPDGVERVFANVTDAARAYGCAPASLPVLLSRGGGQCAKRVWHYGAPGLISCRRLVYRRRRSKRRLLPAGTR